MESGRRRTNRDRGTCRRQLFGNLVSIPSFPKQMLPQIIKNTYTARIVHGISTDRLGCCLAVDDGVRGVPGVRQTFGQRSRTAHLPAQIATGER